MKNHTMINGKLLQQNKKFSQLKNSQKEKIANWFYEEYAKHRKNTEENEKSFEKVIISDVYTKIEEAEIWIPIDEITAYYKSHINKFRKRYEKEEVNRVEM